MKKVTYIKFGLDLLLGVAFALFFNDRVLGGLTFHEIVGLGFGAAIIVHVILNINWVKKVTRKLFDRSLPGKTRFSYLLNLLLLIMMMTIILTGVIISKVVFPNLTLGNERWLQMLHLSVSYFTLVLVAVHVGLHWQWAINLTKKIFKISRTPSWMDYAIKMAVVGLFLFGTYEIVATGFGMRLVSLATIFTGSEQGSFGEMDGKGFVRGQFSDGGEILGGLNGERPAPPDGGFPANGEIPSSRSGGFERNDNVSKGQTPDTGTSFGDEDSLDNGDFSRENRDFPTNAEMPNGFQRGMYSGKGQSPNALGVIATYFGIMAVFVMITHYLGKLKLYKRQKNAVV
ncbi:DUF4405 domain-containing protein [Bacillus marasmi]|uniref:DUF4405 domain-containing protein n=1 Tax=Bacillus marasmi TaxID=1926279 RepID=UPI00164D77D3|nr:DUF4405 domain-containing protein [Bacillus marasmi]